MSHTPISLFRRDGWWGQLGLQYSGLRVAEQHPNLVLQAALRVLHDHPPVAFASTDGASALSLDELAELIQVAITAAEQVAREERERATAIRHTKDQARFESAYTMANADEVLTGGPWAGFSKGDAFGWSWSLFQYEPHGFVHPGSQVRAEALQKLTQGELPNVFGYPLRARELANSGLTPRQYRFHKEALGATTFDPSEVKHR